MSRKQLAILIIVISIVDGLLIGAVVSATTGPHVGIPLGAAVMALPWMLMKGLSPLIWRMLALHHVERQFPLRDPAAFDENAKVVSMCARQAWLAANNCIEVATDDDALHIRMALPGVPPRKGASIPWESITSIDPGRVMTRFEIAGHPPMWLPRVILAREYELRQMPVPEDDTSLAPRT